MSTNALSRFWPAFALLNSAALLWVPTAALASQEALEREAARASCLIEANSTIKLSSATQGTLSAVNITRGQTVRAGEIVAQLESDVEIAQYEAAKLRAQTDVLVSAKKAELDAAELKLRQSRQLISTNATPMQKFEEAQTAATLAKLGLEQAQFEKQIAGLDAERLKATIERRLVRSPVNGVVTKLELHAGEYADPASPIAMIAENRPLLVEVYLPVEVYPDVRSGMPIVIKPRQPIGGAYSTVVANRDPVIDSASGTFQVKAYLANEDAAVPAGIRCSVEFPAP